MGKLQVKNRGFRVSLIPESFLYAGAMNNEEGEIHRGISPRYSGNLDEKSPLSGCIYFLFCNVGLNFITFRESRCRRSFEYTL